MNERQRQAVHEYLDGELPREALPEEVRDEAAAFDRLLEPLAPAPVELPSGVRYAVMSRVRAEAGLSQRRGWGWLVRPRLVPVSPLTGGLALAAAVAVILLARPVIGPAPVETVTQPAGSSVHFVLVAPAAQEVAVTGDFVSWDPGGILLTRRGSNGVWVAEVELEPGIYHYLFVVDGTHWQPDPNATSQIDDGFGQQNSVLFVPKRQAS